MNILHVEDYDDWFNTYVKPRLTSNDEIHHATTKEYAIELLSKYTLDYVILDLAIPLDNIDTSPSTAHGQALAVYIRDKFPGMPILILTGQSSEDAAQDLEDDNSFTFFWDGNNKNLVKIRKKRDLDKALDVINEANDLLAKVDNIELKLDKDARNLTAIDKRIIRLFGKCHDTSGANVVMLKSGLSDSNVLMVDLFDSQKNTIQRAVAKIDTAIQIDLESSNYKSHVRRLPVGSFPVELGQYYAGCGSRKGVFYQLASEYKSNYFDVLIKSDDLAVELINKLKAELHIWHNAKSSKETSIREIRQLLCVDEKLHLTLEHLDNINWENFENNVIKANWSIQHGDLHGVNILVSQENHPIIIDYGDIQSLPCSLDPITLEISPFFHPYLEGRFLDPNKLAQHWFDDEEYFELSPTPNTSRVLRKWAGENAFLDREKLAVTYSYCMCQLTYPNTNKRFALELIKAIIGRFE